MPRPSLGPGPDHMSGGALAWLYLRPHEVAWSVPSAAQDALGYTVTEERQSLFDNELGACVRYLVMQDQSTDQRASVTALRPVNDHGVHE